MEKASLVYKEVKHLDEKGLISLKWIGIWLTTIIVVMISILWLWSVSFPEHSGGDHYKSNVGKAAPTMKFNKKSKKWFGIIAIHIAMIITCPDERVQNVEKVSYQTLLTMKSAVIFSTKIIHFHLFVDETMYQEMLNQLDDWPIEVRHRVSFSFKSVYASEAPQGFDSLFIPLSFYYLNEMLFAKPGVLFTGSLDTMWDSFVLQNNSTSSIISVGMRGDGNARYCLATPVVTVDNFVYDTSVVFYNLKKLRRALIKVPFFIQDKKTPSLLFGDSFETFSWSSEMIRRFQSYSDFSNDGDADKYALNLILLFNPVLLTVSHDHNINSLTKLGQFLYPIDNVKPSAVNNSLVVKKWKLVANFIEKADFLNNSNLVQFNSFISFILSSIF